MSISEDKIEEVRSRIDLAQVVGRKVELRRSGRSLVGLCPFHNERSPSFYVHPDKGFYHCFGCQASGDVFEFICETEHRAFPEVVRDLAKECGVEVEEQKEAPEERKARERRDFLYRVNDYVSGFFQHWFWNERDGKRAREYVRERQVNDETARAFAMGYAPRRAEPLIEYLKHKNIPVEAAVELGVLGTREDKSHYLRFFDRVIFPIWDSRDRIAGFGGRVLDADAKAAKYLNSPESMLFRKSQLLYGYNKAKNAIARKGSAWLCEGYLDVIALHQAGLEQAIAPLGTAVGPDHVPLLRRVTGKVVTMFDGDGAGQRATRKTTELLLAHGFAVHVMALPDGDDPDTLVLREGEAKVRERAETAPAAVQYFIEQAAQTMKPSVEGRVAAASDIAPLLAKVTSQLERDLYVREAAKLFSIDESVLRRHFGRKNAPAEQARAAAERRPAGATAQPVPAPVAVEKPSRMEFKAVLELLSLRVTWDVLPAIEPLLSHAGLRRIVHQCIENDAEVTYEMMEELLGSPQLARDIAAALCEDLSRTLEPGQAETIMSATQARLEHEGKARRLTELQRRIGQALENGESVTELVRERDSLRESVAVGKR